MLLCSYRCEGHCPIPSIQYVLRMFNVQSKVTPTQRDIALEFECSHTLSVWLPPDRSTGPADHTDFRTPLYRIITQTFSRTRTLAHWLYSQPVWRACRHASARRALPIAARAATPHILHHAPHGPKQLHHPPHQPATPPTAANRGAQSPTATSSTGLTRGERPRHATTSSSNAVLDAHDTTAVPEVKPGISYLQHGSRMGAGAHMLMLMLMHYL